MNIREQIQENAVKAFISSSRKSIVKACPRFGKIRVAFKILAEEGAKKVLICYPRNDIKKGWEDEIDSLDVEGIDIQYVTFRSLRKAEGEWDYFIIDEIHEASDNELDVMDRFIENLKTIALTGTMTAKTEKNIIKRTGLNVCFDYRIEDGVRDGILTNYSITVHYVELDDRIKVHVTKKGRQYTEKGWWRLQEWIKRQQGGGAFFERRQILLIQDSVSKLRKTRALLRDSGDERVLVFCGTTKTADELGIPVYHSGNKDEQVFNDFCKGKGNKLATVKLMQAGITIKPINKAIINYTSGNPEDCAQKICRMLGWEYNNPEKKAEIHIVCSTEEFEKGRLRTALLFFEESKITYIN